MVLFLSRALLPTLKEVPAGTLLDGHRMLIRGGFIRNTGRGLYALLPMGQRVLDLVAARVAAAMDGAGGHRMSLPVLTPLELWQASGRNDVMGPELMRVKDRREHTLCLAPTHEEAVTDLVAGLSLSRKQYPLLLYQLGTKVRDEIRPRFGVLRAREFVMKDMYSFHTTPACVAETFEEVKMAYQEQVFDQDIPAVCVEADSGAMGGDASAEFHILHDVGEDKIVACTRCKKYANHERIVAEGRVVPGIYDPGTVPDASTGLPAGVGQVPLRGCLDGVERYLLVEAPALQALSLKEIGDATGLTDLAQVHDPDALDNLVADGSRPPLFCGPTERTPEGFEHRGLPPGACQAMQACEGQGDQPGPPCALESHRGIEVGHIFQLGDKYSKAHGATFSDTNGRPQPLLMGCYGIGVSRIVGALAEVHSDSQGIVWPAALAPYRACIVFHQTAHLKDATKIVDRLSDEARRDVVVDDRPVSLAFKLKDAALVGYPVVVVLGRTFAETQGAEIEVQHRSRGEKSRVSKLSDGDVISLIELARGGGRRQ